MPFQELKTIIVRCDRCGKYGGQWQRERREECIPEGWSMEVVQDPIRGTDLVRSWEELVCRQCLEAESSTS